MKLNIKELRKYTINTRLLIVEDDRDLNENIFDLLNVLFDDIEMAYNGEEGLAKYQESINSSKKFDIVITDINMPKMDGFELIKEVRAIDKKQQIIVTTAYDDNSSLMKLIDLQINRFVLKTSIYSTLIGVVTDIAKEIYNEKIVQLYLNEAKKIKDSSCAYFKNNKFSVAAIDDSSTQLFFYKDILKDLDINLVTFSDGYEFLEHIKHEECNLVLLDVQMPKIDGFEIARRLSLDPDTCNIPVVFVTSVAIESKFIEQGYTLGAIDYIIKDSHAMISIFNKVKIYSELFAKQMELQDFNKKLEDKVKQQTVKLQTINLTLEDRIKKEIAKNRDKDRLMFQQAKFAAMGEMIANIAHQWRQPLTALSAIIQSIELKNRLNRLTHEFVDKQTKDAKSIANQMSQTIDDFKNFFKANKSTERFKLKSLFDNELNVLDNVLKSSAIHIESTIDDNIEIVGIRSELFQIILNILNNAKDVLTERAKRDKIILVDVQNSTISLNNEKSKKDVDSIVINIIDNAGGIDKEIIEKIFEPYFTTKHNSHGTGIGLYMSKEIVEKSMYGKICAKNHKFDYDGRDHHGAKFTIELPINLDEVREFYRYKE
jgi:signal transduction histidine kinase/ActR/RegA family two-component response regulator